MLTGAQEKQADTSLSKMGSKQINGVSEWAQRGWFVKSDHPAEGVHGVSAQWNEEQWVGRRVTASSYTGGLCSIQIFGAGSVGGKASANGVYSVETS